MKVSNCYLILTRFHFIMYNKGQTLCQVITLLRGRPKLDMESLNVHRTLTGERSPEDVFTLLFTRIMN